MDPKTRFLYLYDNSTTRRPVATVAYRIVPGSTGAWVTQYATAVAHPNDQFCRARGRAAAQGRLDSEHVALAQLPLTEVSNKSAIEKIMSALQGEQYFNHRTGSMEPTTLATLAGEYLSRSR